MKKRILVAVLSVAMLVSIVGTAFASVEPRTNRLNGVLRFDGRTAHCSAALAEGGASLKLVMTLKRGDFAYKVWSTAGTGLIGLGETYVVPSAGTYTLEFDYWVNGVRQPTLQVYNSCD